MSRREAMKAPLGRPALRRPLAPAGERPERGQRHRRVDSARHGRPRGARLHDEVDRSQHRPGQRRQPRPVQSSTRRGLRGPEERRPTRPHLADLRARTTGRSGGVRHRAPAPGGLEARPHSRTFQWVDLLEGGQEAGFSSPDNLGFTAPDELGSSPTSRAHSSTGRAACTHGTRTTRSSTCRLRARTPTRRSGSRTPPSKPS